jgi:hypothetical protein
MAARGHVERDDASFWPVLKVAAAAGMSLLSPCNAFHRLPAPFHRSPIVLGARVGKTTCGGYDGYGHIRHW